MHAEVHFELVARCMTFGADGTHKHLRVALAVLVEGLQLKEHFVALRMRAEIWTLGFRPCRRGPPDADCGFRFLDASRLSDLVPVFVMLRLLFVCIQLISARKYDAAFMAEPNWNVQKIPGNHRKFSRN